MWAQDERSRKAVDLAQDLISQSLEASRSLTVELSPTILYEAGLDAAIPWLARQFEVRHGLKVDTQINATVAQDEAGVAFLLFSAVRELLLNVVKHARIDSARVQMDRIDGDLVRIIVSDKGAGFDPVKINAGEDAATGLGLFGPAQRLEHVGGQCVIESKQGRWTRVTLTAKVGRPANTAGEPGDRFRLESVVSRRGPRGASSRRQDSRASGGMIMQSCARGLAGILNAESDIEVVAEALSGEQAIMQAVRFRPDVIIMDVSMPGMNGIDATKAILAERPETKIIGLSMYEEADRAEAIRQAGAVNYLTKSGPSDALVAAIRDCAGRR